jgi:hypothetical protein
MDKNRLASHPIMTGIAQNATSGILANVAVQFCFRLSQRTQSDASAEQP